MPKKTFEPQEYVLGPVYNRGPPIWRYRKMLCSEDGEVRHLLEMPGNPGHEVVVKDDEVQLLANRRFFSYGTGVYHKPDDCVMPRQFCTMGQLNGELAATRLAAFLEAGGEALSRRFHDLFDFAEC